MVYVLVHYVVHMVHGAFETRESGASTSTAASDVDSELTETTTILLIKSSFSTGNLRLEKCATKPCIYVRLVNTKNFSPIAQHRDNKLSVRALRSLQKRLQFNRQNPLS